LILLDVSLRDVDGFEVLGQLKQDPATENIPVIITSIVIEREKGFALGVADYLHKPAIDHDQLRTSVRRVLAAWGVERGTSPSVLVVDDEADIRRWMRLALTDEGFQVTEAADGEQALALVAATPPNLILLDLVMPKMDGWTVIRKLKEDAKTAEIPIIVLTASALDPQHAKVQVLGMGAQQLLTKPVSLETLVGEIKKQLTAKKSPAGVPKS